MFNTQKLLEFILANDGVGHFLLMRQCGLLNLYVTLHIYETAQMVVLLQFGLHTPHDQPDVRSRGSPLVRSLVGCMCTSATLSFCRAISAPHFLARSHNLPRCCSLPVKSLVLSPSLPQPVPCRWWYSGVLGIQVLTTSTERLEWVKSNRNPNVEAYVANMFQDFQKYHDDEFDLPSVSTG